MYSAYIIKSMEKPSQIGAACCKECTSKESLITKYTNLIRLLKKQNDKIHLSTSLKKSDVGTTSNTSAVIRDRHVRNQLCYLLQTLFNRQERVFFRKAQFNSHLTQLKAAAALTLAFNPLITRKMSSAFTALSQNKHGEAETGKVSTQQSVLQHFVTTDSINSLYRRCYSLEVENRTKTEKISIIQKRLKETESRSIRESLKKQQSLQMLAEDLSQKNDLISQLQRTIQIYEQQTSKSIHNNVLEINYQRELGDLEKMNEKLAIEDERHCKEIDTLKKHNQQLTQALGSLQESSQELQRQNLKLEVEVRQYQSQRANQGKINEHYLNKLQELKINLNLAIRMCKDIAINKQQHKDNPQFNYLQHLQERLNCFKDHENEYKVQQIFQFLCNIENKTFTPADDLFDSEEQELLYKLRDNYHKIAQELRVTKQQVEQKLLELFNHQQQQQQQPKQEIESRLSEGTNRYESEGNSQRQNFTIRLLQMELDKNSLVERVSEEKNKFMHIRSLVLNLLKNVEMKNMGVETQGILDIVMDMFEYSEEEKQEIIDHGKKKEKSRLFGFM